MPGTIYVIMIQFTDGTIKYYNGKPASHCYHAPNKLGAKKWKTFRGAEKALVRIPKHGNQQIFISEL